ncbi:MAG: cyclic nucleotide-binding domain-containing protein [Devosia sp.]|nr:cyclic nucleotide-binding domain-containing protein [Devosia sp.]
MKQPVVDFEVLSRIGGERRQFKAGEVVFKAGDPGREFFVVRDGTVAVQVGGRTVERLGPSEIFGEMAIVDAKPRSATVVAETDCSLVPMSEKQFLLMVREAPYFALGVMRVLAQRLRAANSEIAGQ